MEMRMGKKQDIMVSIVTVCYNSEKTIRDTIESVLHQTYTNIEYLIIDGKSKDKTVSIAEGYRSAFEEKGMKYIVISEPDNGIYDAMNKGTKRSAGELVGILNSDDWYEENAVERVVDTYKNTGFDMFYADIRLIKPDGSEIIKHSRYRKYATSRDWNHPTTFVKRTIYDRFGFQCKVVYDDWDFILKVRNAGYKIVVLNEVLANFRMGGASNEGGIKRAFGKVKERYQIYRQNGMSRFYFLECLAHETAKALLKGR